MLTHHVPEDEEDPAYEFLSGDIQSAVGKACDADGGKDVLVIGTDVGRQCVEQGLIDEIVVYVAPVLLGGGVPFFHCPGLPRPVRLRGDARHAVGTTFCS